jgi:SAM-dependent methyltransferase
MSADPSQSQEFLARFHRAVTEPFYGRLAWAFDSFASLGSGGLYYRWVYTAERFIKDQPVLEVGCGRGRLAQRLAGGGFQVIAVDKSPQMVDAARQRLAGTRLPAEVICADGGSLPLPDASVGTIINTFPTRYVLAKETWAEYSRVLRPGGRWVCILGVRTDRFHLRNLGMYVVGLLMSRSSKRLIRNGLPGIGVSRELFAVQQEEFVPVGPTSALVWILEKGPDCINRR